MLAGAASGSALVVRWVGESCGLAVASLWLSVRCVSGLEWVLPVTAVGAGDAVGAD